MKVRPRALVETRRHGKRLPARGVGGAIATSVAMIGAMIGPAVVVVEPRLAHAQAPGPDAATAGEPVVVPPRLIEGNAPRVPEGARSSVPVTVMVALVVDVDGSVRDPVIHGSGGGDGVDQVALDAVLAWRFTPATRDGRPVATRILVAVELAAPAPPHPPSRPFAASSVEQVAPSAAPAIDVVVLGPPRHQPREDRAAAASVITADRARRGGESVAELVGELPGVSVTRAGGLGSLALVSLRGSTWEQVGVYVDGVPLNAAVGGGVDLSTISLGDVERIEVYRGVSPLAFGASSIGGVLSIATRTPRENRFEGEAGAGAFGTYLGAARGSAVWGRWGAYAGVSWQGSDGDFGFPSNNGTAFDVTDDGVLPRRNNAMEQLGATLRAGVRVGDDREVVAAVSLFRSDQGLPGFGVYETERASLGLRRVTPSVTFRSGGAKQDVRVTGTAYAGLTESRFFDPLSEIAYGATDARDRTELVGSTWHVEKRWAAVRWAGVVDARWERFRPTDQEQDPPRGPPASRRFGAVGLEAGIALGTRTELIPSARVELARDVVSGRTLFQDFVPAGAPLYHAQPIARLSAIHNQTGALALKANLGRYQRLPNFTELYGDSGFVLGNPELASESGWSGDLGAVWAPRSEHVAVHRETFAFASVVDDLIQYQQAGQGVQRARNFGEARVLGIESSVRVDALRHARILGQVTFTDARDVSDVAAANDKQLPLRPRFRGSLRPELHRLRVGSVGVLAVYAELDITSGNYLDRANLVQMPSRTLLGVGGSLEQRDGRWSIAVAARNLTDSRIHDLSGYPLPGRSVFATLGTRWAL